MGGGFTVAVLTPVAMHMYDYMGNNPAYVPLGRRGIVLIVIARVAWELENHLCTSFPGVWPLHSVWHFGSCLAANDLFLLGYYYRIDMLGAGGIVHLEKPSRGSPALPMLLFAPEAARELVESANRKAE